MSAPLSLTGEGSLYERVGRDALADLVRHFYARVALDPQLAPIFPADLTMTAEKQFAFLSGFMGGPPLYHERFGSPMLRARHLPHPITPARARAWLACMNGALRDTPAVAPREAAELYAALSRVAQHMVNTPDEAAQEH